MPILVEIANGSMGSRHLFEAAFQVRLQRRPLGQRKRAKLRKWADKAVPIREQAKRLRVSQAAVYAMRSRMIAARNPR